MVQGHIGKCSLVGPLTSVYSEISSSKSSGITVCTLGHLGASEGMKTQRQGSVLPALRALA